MAAAHQPSTSSSVTAGPHQIFLSHSGSQKGFASDLYHRLFHTGYSVFFDITHHSLTPAHPFPDLIHLATQLPSCKLAIVVLSEEFLTSPWLMRELCAFAGRYRRSKDPAAAPADPEVAILPLFFKVSAQDLKNEQRLETWHRTWTGWQDQQGNNAGRMSCSEQECEAAVRLLRSLNGVIRGPEREEGEGRYIDHVMEAVANTNVAASSPLKRPFEDPHKFHVGKERLCKTILEQFLRLEGYASACDVISIVGVYGLPGSGKSTLCELLCDSMYHEFHKNVVTLMLHTELHALSSDSPNIRMSAPNRHDSPKSTNDLTHLYDFFPGSRFEDKKKFMALDNISASNYEGYKNMVKNLLALGRAPAPLNRHDSASRAILTPGSRLIVTARSETILQNLRRDLERELSRPQLEYRYAIMQIPSLTKDEAIELICHHYLGRMELHANIDILPRFSFGPASYFQYIPQVLRLIVVSLRKNICAHEDEDKLRVLEENCGMVDESKVDAAEELVGKIYKDLPKDLQRLFLDIALFIVPLYNHRHFHNIGNEGAVSILSKLQGTSTCRVKMNMTELREQCLLEGYYMGVHGIFVEYARSVPESSESYVNIIVNFPDSVVRCPKARTMCVDLDTRLWDESEEEAVHVEVGPQMKALFVRNREKEARAKLHLSGCNPSSLVYLGLNNVQLIKWPTASICSSSSSSSDMQMTKRPRLQHAGMRNLAVLQLINASIPGSLDGIHWGQLEVLHLEEIRDRISLTIGSNSPKLKQLPN